MEESSILWVAAVLIAIVACSSPLTGCSSQPLGPASGPPIASPSDTNIFPSGSLSSDASEVSKRPTDLPSANAKGTTGPNTSR
jgi:hypothetical protein